MDSLSSKKGKNKEINEYAPRIAELYNMNNRGKLEKNKKSFREQWYYNLYIYIYIYVYLSYSISQLNPKRAG